MAERSWWISGRHEADGHGTLVATYVKRGGGATTTVLYTTADDGDHWKLASTVEGCEALIRDHRDGG